MRFLLLSGFRLDTDAWLKEYETCKDLTQEIVQNIQAGDMQLSCSPGTACVSLIFLSLMLSYSTPSPLENQAPVTVPFSSC